jgi:CheY-like chemotaxis protein
MSLNIKILIIDDDEINNLICTKVIKDYSPIATVDSVTSGSKGLDYLNDVMQNSAEELPDLIFLDINMPAMNGWDFIREYRKINSSMNKEIKLFVLTSSQYYQDSELAEQYVEVQKLITKPLTSEILNEIESSYFE